MNESEDYKRGYLDGFNAAKRPHTSAQMEEIGQLRKRLAETHDLRLVVLDNNKRGMMYGIGEAGNAAADAYNFLAAMQVMPTLKCRKCNIEFQGVVGYYCPHIDCPSPTFAKTI